MKEQNRMNDLQNKTKYVTDTVDRSAVEEACRQMDEILDLPEKRKREYYENHYSDLHPLVQSYCKYLLDPYHVDEASLSISHDDAREIIDYLTYQPSVFIPKGSDQTKESLVQQYKQKYFYEKLKENQRALAYACEPQADMIEAQIKNERTAVKEVEKQIQNEQEELFEAYNDYISRCSPKTQAVIQYDDCRRRPSSCRSGFHGFGNSLPIPFAMCGWATFDGEWGGVAFRINRDCFDGRDAVLYYMDDDFFGYLPDYRLEWLQKIRDRMEHYSSGLTDIHIYEQEESDYFKFRGTSHYPARVTTIQFRLDSSKIKETVEISQKAVPTSQIGEYIFVLPKDGEYYIELGEMIDDTRVPLHYDDFCMK